MCTDLEDLKGLHRCAKIRAVLGKNGKLRSLKLATMRPEVEEEPAQTCRQLRQLVDNGWPLLILLVIDYIIAEGLWSKEVRAWRWIARLWEHDLTFYVALIGVKLLETSCTVDTNKPNKLIRRRVQAPTVTGRPGHIRRNAVVD